jgi:hypothetical protein
MKGKRRIGEHTKAPRVPVLEGLLYFTNLIL